MNKEEAIEAIEGRIEEIESDDRYGTGAQVQTNAVLALMQTEWEGQVNGLKYALDVLQDE